LSVVPSLGIASASWNPRPALRPPETTTSVYRWNRASASGLDPAVLHENSDAVSAPGEFVAGGGPRFAANGTAGELATVTLVNLNNNVDEDFMMVSLVSLTPDGERGTATYFVTTCSRWCCTTFHNSLTSR
jgi:hypothetical protein